MIKEKSDIIYILHADGTKSVFEPEQLQADIIRSSLQSGLRDAWFAEDISLAIEFALRSTTEQTPTYPETDINSIVIKALEETGYPAVANTYRHLTKTKQTKVASDRKLINEIISRYLQMNGDSGKKCADAVENACNKLGIKQASPFLILELAKYYKDQHTPVREITTIAKNISKQHLLSADEVIKQLDHKTVKLIKNGTLRVNSVSSLFPAVKIDLDFYQFVNGLGLDIPLTEMAIYPFLPLLAESVNDIVTTISSMRDCTLAELPLYLRVCHCSEFAQKVLDSSWPEAEPICQDILERLQNLLKLKICRMSFYGG